MGSALSNIDRENAATSLAPASARSSCRSSSPTELAPIALFVYNRPAHTRRTVESLRANQLAPQSDLFVFSDAARNEATATAVQEVRQVVSTIKGFRSVTVIERERNFGLGNSIINGVTHLCHEFGRVIAMEDDLLTTPDFLTFMNQALNYYEAEPRIFSISGFNFALREPGCNLYDALFFYRSSSLGWGTWKDRWEKADWLVADYGSFCNDKDQQRRFNRGGEDLSGMLALQMAGRIDSWAIRWAYSHFKQDALALLSTRPRIYHFGSDGSGTNTRRGSLRQSPLTSERKSEFHFPSQVEIEPDLAAELHRLLRPSIARQFVRWLRRIRWAMSPLQPVRPPLPKTGLSTPDGKKLEDLSQ
jgi:glycosyltransferase involved in cell wall biosynthesis